MHLRYLKGKEALVWVLAILLGTGSYAQPIQVPQMLEEEPAPGKRVKVIAPEYKGSDVYHSLYLPENHSKGRLYPVIVEYTGNKWEPTGSTGEARDAILGFVPARELGAIWVVMPYIKDNQSILNWWGDEHQTIEYALKNIRRICEDYGGNPAEIFICGFSRGAIGVNYLGLHNDEVADAWLGFFSHDHYDGERHWGDYWSPSLDRYRAAAKVRMGRLNGRAAFISNNSDGKSTVRKYIEGQHLDKFGEVAFNDFLVQSIIEDIPNKYVPHAHTDKWMLWDSHYKNKVISWFREVIKNKPGTYSVSGTVRDVQGKPIEGAVIESGRSHFSTTDKQGRYKLEGLIRGNRHIIINPDMGFTKTNPPRQLDLQSDVSGIDFIVR